jgi:hypothetical protein
MSARSRVITGLLGVVAFGVLMALRSQVAGTAARAAVAAMAFACLGVILVWTVRKANNTAH